MARIFRLLVALALAFALCSPHPAAKSAASRASIKFAQSQPAAQPAPGPDRAWWANGQPDGISAPRYSGVTRTSRYVTMHDGVRLAADIYLPKNLAAGTRLPTILEQTRYLRSFEFKPEIRQAMDRPAQKVVEFVTRGYAYVIVDVRGSGASFGSRHAELSREEVHDGAEVVDWIIKQPWSAGRVGATGVSYVGTTAELLLVNQPPAVKAVVPQFALFDAYPDIVLPGGILHTSFMAAWGRTISLMDQNRFSELRPQIIGVRPLDEDTSRSLLAEAIRAHATNVDINAEVSHLTFRDDRALHDWTLGEVSPFTYLKNLSAARAAIYSYSGWFDGGYQRAAINRFRAVRNPGSRLVIGPWSHGGAYYYSPALGLRRSSFPHTLELLRFFDCYLKDAKTGIASEPRVRYYTMGEERWHSAGTWPLPNTQMQTWYLSGNNVLSRTRPAQAGGQADTYRVDYTAGSGNQSRWNTLVGGGAVNYPDRREEDRKLLTYTSAPLAQDMEVTGHPVVTLHVNSTATDGEFFVYLEEVDEAGHVSYITEGELRAIQRKVSDSRPPYKILGPYHTFLRRDAQPLVPGQVAQLAFDLLPTSYLFRQGRSIRISIAGADKDHFALLPDEAPTLRFYRSGVQLSRIALPVIPRR